jgi:hypothetical protein
MKKIWRFKVASDYIKNIILDEKNNRIIADIADGNIYPLTFKQQKELYSNFDSYEEKYGSFIWGLVSGTLRCANESNKLAKLETSKALKNYYDDYRVLGAKEVYRKYKDVIYQILYEGLENDKQEIIPSELDLHYKMKILSNKTFNEVCNIFQILEKITEDQGLSKSDKQAKYTEQLNQLLDENERNRPMFTLYRNKNPNILVSVYPSLEKNTYKDDIFLSYYFNVKNIETNYEKIYAHNGMMISYLLYDEKMTKQVLHEIEQKFIEDEQKEINKVQKETEDLGEQE